MKRKKSGIRYIKTGIYILMVPLGPRLLLRTSCKPLAALMFMCKAADLLRTSAFGFSTRIDIFFLYFFLSQLETKKLGVSGFSLGLGLGERPFSLLLDLTRECDCVSIGFFQGFPELLILIFQIFLHFCAFPPCFT